MHKVDRQLTRKELGSFSINGNKYKVLQPTIGQRIMQMEEHEDVLAEAKKFQEEDNVSELIKLNLRWQRREIEIFFPNMKPDDLDSITEGMREEIFEILFPSVDVDEKPSKKKGSHGEKK